MEYTIQNQHPFKVPKRGCTAFSKLVIALAESGNCDAAMILDPENAAR